MRIALSKLAYVLGAIFILASFSGAGHAQTFESGLRAYDAGDYAKALTLWKKEAERRNGKVAAYNVAEMYYHGEGTPQDLDEAEKYYQLAASRGYKPAKRRLRELFSPSQEASPIPSSTVGTEKAGVDRFVKGPGFNSSVQSQGPPAVPVDPETSQSEFEQAVLSYDKGDLVNAFGEFLRLAEKGHASAQFNVAEMYAHGEGTERNFAEAAKWYEEAAKRQFKDAYPRLLEQATSLAQIGDSVAQNALGNLYLFGSGVEKDYEQAKIWFTRSAEQGYIPGQLNIAQMYDRGLGVLRDYSESAKWYFKAATAGSPEGQFNLAIAYLRGEGVLKSKINAYALFNVLSANGDKEAGIARDGMEPSMTPNQIAEAQALSRKLIKGEFDEL